VKAAKESQTTQSMDAPHAFDRACGLLIQAAEAHDKPGFAGYFIHPPPGFQTRICR
jgi:hypothetical protein